jgi:hypothetical protein
VVQELLDFYSSYMGESLESDEYLMVLSAETHST